ncbi:6484_t:CDS:2 [Entrophospora sp. SA101]|nr:6484_t:CDS:2 [Entrophospora sp. SA101]
MNPKDSKYTYLALGIPVKKTVNNQSQIKSAYDLVAADLFQTLKKAKDGAVIKLGNCGAFHKKRTTIQSALDGNTYRYYRISFKLSEQLKVLLLVVAAVCVGLYFYGQQLKKDNDHSIIMNNFQPNNQTKPTENNSFDNLNQNNRTQPESSGLMKMVGQSLPFLPLLFEQFTGQKIPQMGGTIAEMQLTLSQVLTMQQQILTNQQTLNQRLVNLENNASSQFTNLTNQVQSIKSIRLSHERKQIDYNLQQTDEPNKY